MASDNPRCLVCGSEELGQVIETKEMFFGLEDRFQYRQCSSCESLRIVPIPGSLDRYYPPDYYSISRAPREPSVFCKLAHRWNCVMDRARLPLPNPFATVGERMLRDERVVRDMKVLGATRHSRVLDVGCGRGDDLRVLRTLGYRTLVGADPYLDDSVKEEGLRLLKRSIHEVDEIFDVITFNHSLEHLPDPRAVLEKAGSMLANGGGCLIRTPIAPSHALKRYGGNWVQLDPPRHLFIPSVAGLRALLDEYAIVVDRVVYDSTAFQFWGSELYERGVPLVSAEAAGSEGEHFDEDEMRAFEDLARKVNASREGDQVSVYARKEG